MALKSPAARSVYGCGFEVATGGSRLKAYKSIERAAGLTGTAGMAALIYCNV